MLKLILNFNQKLSLFYYKVHATNLVHLCRHPTLSHRADSCSFDSSFQKNFFRRFTDFGFMLRCLHGTQLYR